MVFIAFLIGTAIPLGRYAFAHLPLLGLNRPTKLTAGQTTLALRARLPWAPQNDHKRDIRCEDHARTSDAADGRTGAFDYVCTFLPPPVVSRTRLKVGVRVDAQRITHVSTHYPLEAPYIR